MVFLFTKNCEQKAPFGGCYSQVIRPGVTGKLRGFLAAELAGLRLIGGRPIASVRIARLFRRAFISRTRLPGRQGDGAGPSFGWLDRYVGHL